MKKIIFILSLLAIAGTASAQFPSKDSAERFINKWIRNSAIDAFTNLRLNQALIYTLRYADSANVISFTALNDSTLRLITRGKDTFTVVVRGTGGGSGSGTVNTGTQYQLAYYAANGTEVSGHTIITGNRALASDANGLPVASTTTATELGYVNGVTSSIQTQLNAKASQSALNDTSAAIRAVIGSGGVAWGGISGTLSSQTDLQSALDAKVPTARTVTINGTTQDLSANRTWTLTKSDVGLGNVDNTSDVNKPLSTAQATAIHDTAQTIRTARKWPAEERLGTIYDKQRWDNLQDFTPNAASGTVSLALSTNFVNYTVTTIDWNNYTRLLYTRPTILPNWTIEVIFKMNTAPSASTVGFGLGTKKYISQNADVMCYINTTNGGSSGNLNILRADGGATYGTPVATGAISQNDVVRLRVTFADSVVTFSALNLTTGSSGTMSYTSPLNSTPPLSAIANWGLIGHSTGSCTWQIQSIKITSETKRNATLVVVGDSKTQGAFANAFNNRYGTKLGIDYPSSYIYASGGATAADFLNLRDELMDLNGMQYFIHLGSNSIRGGTTVVNTIKDLRALVNWLKGGGATVRLGIAPEDSTGGGSGGGVGLTALKNAMVAEFPTEYFDIWTGMSTSNVLSATYNSGDGVHINQAGNDYIRNTIVSGAIFTTRPANMIASYRVTDGNIIASGDTLGMFPIDKKLSYVPSWTIQGGLTTGILQDNGTNSGASATPLTPITGSVFNVTGMMSINGSAGSIVFGNQGSALSSGRYSLLASSNEFVLFDPVAGVNRMTVNSSGFMGLGTPSQDRKLDILDASNPQMRLTNVDGSVYTDFQTLSTGNLRITPSNGEVQLGSATDFGAYSLQNTGGLYQNGAFNLRGTIAAAAPTYVLFKQSDSAVSEGIGTSNQVLGVNNAGTAHEYKTITAGSGTSVTHGAGSVTIAVTGSNFNSSTYLPSLTNVANAGTLTANTCRYRQIGNEVEVWGFIGIDPTTTATITTIGLELPVASSFVSFSDLIGTGFSDSVQQGFAIKADVANSRATIEFNAIDVSNANYFFRFSYVVTPP